MSEILSQQYLDTINYVVTAISNKCVNIGGTIPQSFVNPGYCRVGAMDVLTRKIDDQGYVGWGYSAPHYWRTAIAYITQSEGYRRAGLYMRTMPMSSTLPNIKENIAVETVKTQFYTYLKHCNLISEDDTGSIIVATPVTTRLYMNLICAICLFLRNRIICYYGPATIGGVECYSAINSNNVFTQGLVWLYDDSEKTIPDPYYVRPSTIGDVSLTTSDLEKVFTCILDTIMKGQNSFAKLQYVTYISSSSSSCSSSSCSSSCSSSSCSSSSSSIFVAYFDLEGVM